ncbi:MAG: SPW repeat protein [Bacteroidales bacterium]|nr:SPW repeat protein [Bacteroidales bacterium]
MSVTMTGSGQMHILEWTMPFSGLAIIMSTWVLHGAI